MLAGGCNQSFCVAVHNMRSQPHQSVKTTFSVTVSVMCQPYKTCLEMKKERDLSRSFSSQKCRGVY
jgi:hypothetical protein